jgi:hypothetical protein
MQRFEQRVVAHLREHFPQRMMGIAEQTAREFIQFCIERARGYGIQSERDVVLFVNVALALGQRFDEDPRFKWAADILVDEFIVTPAARVEELHRRTVEFLDAPHLHRQREMSL